MLRTSRQQPDMGDDLDDLSETEDDDLGIVRPVKQSTSPEENAARMYQTRLSHSMR